VRAFFWVGAAIILVLIGLRRCSRSPVLQCDQAPRYKKEGKEERVNSSLLLAQASALRRVRLPLCTFNPTAHKQKLNHTPSHTHPAKQEPTRSQGAVTLSVGSAKQWVGSWWGRLQADAIPALPRQHSPPAAPPRRCQGRSTKRRHVGG